ncbi:DENN domain-containing 2D-like isoform X1 [Labeo rohita]|uniref:DENN domain-containing 2D-like isoform X1 n=1 Tax=Labeo rohita TaxID=84645 RepID=A0A498LVX4_LABRO|nr:DENN domain-containing 2D-like isoform X1 [Labeo rohita]
MVQTEKAEDEQLISALQQAVQQPLRKLFSVLSWEDTLEKINELGNPKTRKAKDVPMFCEVTEVAKSIIDAGEQITVDLMAKLIKFQLLTIKNNDIARRAAEQKAVEDNARGKAGLNSAGKDQGGKGALKGKKAAELPVPTKDTKLKQVETLKQKRQWELDVFWKQLDQDLNSGNKGSRLSDVARLNYNVKIHLVPQDKGNTEAMVNGEQLAFGAAIFEGVACLIYDSLDWRRQYSHYLSCMRLSQVPEACRSIQQSRPQSSTEVVQTPRKKAVSEDDPAEPESLVLSTEVDTRYYCDLLDRIPTEITSVPLILHCMLEQVLDGFDVIKIEADIMKQSHVWTNLMSRCTESAIDRLTRSQELLHFCTDESMSWSELQRLLQLFVFESMMLTTVDENGCIKESQSDPPNPTPWDNPVEFTKHLYWSNRRLPGSAKSNTGTDELKGNEVTVTDLQKTLIRQLGHWNFVEKHSAYVFPQVLQSVSETYRCVDTFHCSRDNAIYVICHNPMSPQRNCKEFWDASLHTDVGFRLSSEVPNLRHIRTVYKRGLSQRLTQVQVCVKKDGHHFYTHISDKLKDIDINRQVSTHIVLPNPAANVVKPDCETEKFGTFHAVLANGIQLSCSQSKPNKTRDQTLQPTVPSAICADQQLQEQEEEPIKETTVDTKDTKDKKGKADSKVNTEDERQKSVENDKPKYYLEINGGSWTTTTPSGFRVASVAGKKVAVQPILAYHATDPFSGTAVVTREDKVLSVLKKDGTVIVDHADGTRITTFNQQGELQQQQHMSSGEKLVRVEKAEFATVIMDYEGRTCNVIFGDGTSVSATAQGSYEIYPYGGGVLHIDKDGEAVYTSQQQSERERLGKYVMNHNADVLCHVTDPEGNHFQVKADGQVTIMADGSEMKEPETETKLQQNAGFETHPPRLFVVHEDCSASELLRAQDVEDLLQKAYCDSSIAVLTDPLPDSQQSFGITLLRPCPDINTYWLSSKQDDGIIPTQLKSRKWESFPAAEKKTLGPPFGTTLGCSLELKEKPTKSSSICIQPVLECPDVLLVRQMTQHPPVTVALCRKMQDKVKLMWHLSILKRCNQLKIPTSYRKKQKRKLPSVSIIRSKSHCGKTGLTSTERSEGLEDDKRRTLSDTDIETNKGVFLPGEEQPDMGAMKRFSTLFSSFRGKISKDRTGKEPDLPASTELSTVEEKAKEQRYASGQFFFEYLVVVRPKKTKDGIYEPQIIYQFPKRDGMVRFQKEEEEKTLKALTLFCFPEGVNWAPLTEYPSETFSFVLTDVDGTRKNGYCRRLLPDGKGARLPEAYCIISNLACFGLFSKIFDEVEQRRKISMAMIYPFMQSLRESAFPAPGHTVNIKSFIPERGTEIISLTRPTDSWLEHVDFRTLFKCLSDEEVLQVFAATVLERRIIFIADELGTLSQVIHAVTVLLYPFIWQHTLISIVPEILIDVVMAPTPYLLGVQKSLADQVTDPTEMGDEDTILPHKLKDEIKQALSAKNEKSSLEELNRVVPEAFLPFFIKTVGHFAKYIVRNGKEQRGEFQRTNFCKAIESKSTRRFVKKFVQTQMFDLFIQEMEQRPASQDGTGFFDKKISEYQKKIKEKAKKH